MTAVNLLQLDAFSTPQLKKDLDKMRTDWLNTKLQMGWSHFIIMYNMVIGSVMGLYTSR